MYYFLCFLALVFAFKILYFSNRKAVKMHPISENEFVSRVLFDQIKKRLPCEIEMSNLTVTRLSYEKTAIIEFVIHEMQITYNSTVEFAFIKAPV